MSSYQFKLPDIGEGTAEAEIVAWHVKVGDVVKEDQALVDMMTDKATVELTSPVGGTVVTVAGIAGTKAAVGSVLVTLETLDGDGATPTLFHKGSAQEPVVSIVPPPPKSPRLGEAARTPHPGARPAASPSLRRRAAELGIKLESITGTGPNARITASDFDAFVTNEKGGRQPRSTGRAVIEDVTELPLIGMRRHISERMLASKRHIPYFTYVEAVDMTSLEDLRAHMNTQRAPQLPKLTVLPFFMAAIVRAVPRFPQINALFDDEANILRRHGAVHIGFATQTEQGLMVPVVRHAEALDIWQLAAEVARLAAAARSGTAKRDELIGSTITLTSLGPLGGVAATPVINRPEVGIICPNRIVETPVVRDGAIVIRKMMNLSSSFDHRVVDGADAAEFIQHLKSLLEHPAQLFMPGD